VTVEPITVTPARSVGRTVFTQRWLRLAFLHWAVEPGRVASHLPPGVRPDVIDGRTYVGLIPFWMEGVGILDSPGVPYLGSFCETNVRLYSVDRAGRRGVVFVSLDASRLVPVLVARAAGLPYLWSRMRCRRRGVLITYTCRRRWPGPRGARSRIEVVVGERVEGGPLEHFLTARWGLHAAARGAGTLFWPNEHGRWPLHAATVRHLDDQLLAAAGFGDLAARQPDSVLFSPGVDVRFGPRRRV
jgi:hypothetical protein